MGEWRKMADFYKFTCESYRAFFYLDSSYHVLRLPELYTMLLKCLVTYVETSPFIRADQLMHLV